MNDEPNLNEPPPHTELLEALENADAAKAPPIAEELADVLAEELAETQSHDRTQEETS